MPEIAPEEEKKVEVVEPVVVAAKVAEPEVAKPEVAKPPAEEEKKKVIDTKGKRRFTIEAEELLGLKIE